jgi:hypothetical protein
VEGSCIRVLLRCRDAIHLSQFGGGRGIPDIPRISGPFGGIHPAQRVPSGVAGCPRERIGVRWVELHKDNKHLLGARLRQRPATGRQCARILDRLNSRARQTVLRFDCLSHRSISLVIADRRAVDGLGEAGTGGDTIVPLRRSPKPG